MKAFIITVLFALSVHADKFAFIKNDYSKDYEAVRNLIINNNDLAAIKKLKILYNVSIRKKIRFGEENESLWNNC